MFSALVPTSGHAGLQVAGRGNQEALLRRYILEALKKPALASAALPGSVENQLARGFPDDSDSQ